MTTTSQTVFKAGVGFQGLKMKDPQGEFETTLTTTTATSVAEGLELKG
jgi:hypothetical protein